MLGQALDIRVHLACFIFSDTENHVASSVVGAERSAAGLLWLPRTLTVHLTHALVQLVPNVVLLQHVLHRLEVLHARLLPQVSLAHGWHVFNLEKLGPLSHGCAVLVITVTIRQAHVLA